MMVDVLIPENIYTTTDDALNDVREMIEDHLENVGICDFGVHPVDISTIRILMEDSQKQHEGKVFVSLSRKQVEDIIRCLDHTEHRLLEQREECEIGTMDFDYFCNVHHDAREAHEFFEGVYNTQLVRGW